MYHCAWLCDFSFCVGDVAGTEDDASQNSANMESKKCSPQPEEKAKGGRLLKATETSYKDCFILNVLNIIALEKTSL